MEEYLHSFHLLLKKQLHFSLHIRVYLNTTIKLVNCNRNGDIKITHERIAKCTINVKIDIENQKEDRKIDLVSFLSR